MYINFTFLELSYLAYFFLWRHSTSLSNRGLNRTTLQLSDGLWHPLPVELFSFFDKSLPVELYPGKKNATSFLFLFVTQTSPVIGGWASFVLEVLSINSTKLKSWKLCNFPHFSIRDVQPLCFLTTPETMVLEWVSPVCKYGLRAWDHSFSLNICIIGHRYHGNPIWSWSNS